MARIAPRFLVPQPNGKQQFFAGPRLRVDSFGVDSRYETARSSSAFNFFGIDSILFSMVQMDSKRELGSIGEGVAHHHQSVSHRIQKLCI
jgi:hypothetical protein